MQKLSLVALMLCLGSGSLLAAAEAVDEKTAAPAAAKVEAAPAAANAPAPATAATAGKTYGWRGDGSGVFADAKPCTVWGGDKNANVLWTADTGKSYAGPTVAGDVVLVTAEPDKLVCVSRKDGKVRWTRENGAESLPAEMKKELKEGGSMPGGGFATPTPLFDGKRIFVLFGTGIIACYDLDGKRQWVRVLQAESAPGEAGHCASPVLADGKVVCPFGGLQALNPDTGALVWQNREAMETCSTPAVAKIGDATLLVTGSGDCVNAKDGKTLAAGLGDVSMMYPSPLFLDGVVYFPGRTTVAVKLPAKLGEKFNTKPLWSVDIESDVFGTGVSHDGIVYVADGAAMFYAIDAKDGKLIYKKQLDLPTSSSTGIYGSMALAGGNIIVGNTGGNNVVLATGREFKLIQANTTDGGEGCSPAFAGKQMFLRMNDTLACIATK